MKEEISLFNLKNTARGEMPNYGFSNYVISCAYIYSYEKDLLKVSKDDELYSIAKDYISTLSDNLKKTFFAMVNDEAYSKIQNLVFNSLDLHLSGEKFTESSNTTLVNLAAELLDVYNGGGDIVYDMGSGSGFFLANLYRSAYEKHLHFKDLVGQEINVNQAKLSQMALDIISNGDLRFRIKIGNCLDSLNYPYTKGFVFPPFGMKQLLNETSRKSKLFKDIVFTNRNSSEWMFIDQLLSDLNGKRAVAFVPGRALFNLEDAEYRKKIISSGRLEGIIELPNNVLNYTSIKLFVLVFSNNNKYVKFLNAAEMTKIDLRKGPIINLPVREIIYKYNSEYVDVKPIDELLEYSNLEPSRILFKDFTQLEENKFSNVSKLYDLAQVFTGNQYTLGVFDKNGMLSDTSTGYKILTSGDIEDGVINWNDLHSVKLPDEKFDKYAVHQNDVIVTSKSSKVKIAVVDIEPKEKIIVTGGMLVVRPDISKLNPTYFKIFLDSELGQSILKNIQKGAVILTINGKDLSNINVPLIDIEKQQKKALRYNERLSTLYVYKKEIKKIEDSLKYFFEEEE